MKPATAWSIVAALSLASFAALRSPIPFAPAVPLAIAGIGLALARQRAQVLLTMLLPVVFYAAIAAVFSHLDADEVGRGLLGGLRLGATLGLNIAALERVGAERLLDGLRLPPLATAWLAAVVVAAHDVARDAADLVLARRLEGPSAWPRGLRRVRAGVTLLPSLVARALERSTARREALRLAGYATPPSFVPIVAIASLVLADRLLLAALPNVKFTYVAVFLGGVLFGARAGFLAGLFGMALSDLFLTGLYLPPFVQALAVAWLGLLGAAVRPWRGSFGSSGWMVVLAAVGVLATLIFSVLSDLLGVVLSPELGRWDFVRLTILNGLLFNIPAALVNAGLFALAVPAVVEAVAKETPQRG